MQKLFIVIKYCLAAIGLVSVAFFCTVTKVVTDVVHFDLDQNYNIQATRTCGAIITMKFQEMDESETVLDNVFTRLMLVKKENGKYGWVYERNNPIYTLTQLRSDIAKKFVTAKMQAETPMDLSTLRELPWEGQRSTEPMSCPTGGFYGTITIVPAGSLLYEDFGDENEIRWNTSNIKLAELPVGPGAFTTVTSDFSINPENVVGTFKIRNNSAMQARLYELGYCKVTVGEDHNQGYLTKTCP